MTDTARTSFVTCRRQPRPGSPGGAWTAVLGLVLVLQAAAAAPAVPGRDPQRKAPLPTRVAPRFDLDNTVRDPFLPSAILQDPNAAAGGSGTAAVSATPAVPAKTGPVTLDEIVAAVTVQGIYRGGTQVLATVNGNLVQAGAAMPLTVRGQSCPVTVMMVDALAQKVLFKYKNHMFERTLSTARPPGGGVPRK